MSSADLCRANGWKAGTILEGTESGPGWSHTTRIQIIALGEDDILAKCIWEDGKPERGHEGLWTLECRDWREVPNE